VHELREDLPLGEVVGADERIAKWFDDPGDRDSIGQSGILREVNYDFGIRKKIRSMLTRAAMAEVGARNRNDLIACGTR